MAAIALVVLGVASGVSERVVEREVDRIRDTYLPKIQASPAARCEVQISLAHTSRTRSRRPSVDLLGTAATERDGLVQLLAETHDAMTVGSERGPAARDR